MRYILMNRDTKLVSFETEQQMGITEVVDERILSNSLPIGYTDAAAWIDHRNYAKHKEHMKKWLKEWGIHTVDGFLQMTHCLGLNDTLWVKTADSDLCWSDVSLYENEFTDIACHTAFETGLFGLQLSTTTPEFTTDGTFPKCWIKDDAGIHILKQGLSGACNVGLEPYSEYVSSQILAAVFPEVISYDLVKYKGKLCSKCDLFTSDAVGYVPFGRTIDPSRHYTIPGLLQYFQAYDEANHTSFEHAFRRMIVMDALVFNADRHLNNFGFLIDNTSMKIRDFAPIFDFNFSFLCSLTMDDLRDYRESLVKYDLGHKLGGDFDVVGREILTPEILDILPDFIELPLHQKYNMEEERLSLLEDIFHENYERICGKRRMRAIAVPKQSVI